MGTDVAGSEREAARITDEELAAERQMCEAVIRKYGDVGKYPFSRSMVQSAEERLLYVKEAQAARAEAKSLQADRAALLGTVKQFIRDEYPDGTDGASLFVARLEATVWMTETQGGRTAAGVWRWIRERSGACT